MTSDVTSRAAIPPRGALPARIDRGVPAQSRPAVLRRHREMGYDRRPTSTITAAPESAPGAAVWMIHICIRRTLDWRDETLVAARILPEFRAKYDAWNAAFDMPYAAFRHRLKQIAGLSLRRVEGAIQSPLDEVPPGHVIVPVDDDDWFAPDLAVRLERVLDPGAAGYLWRRALIEPPRLLDPLRRVARWLGHPEYTCKTNNYAFVNGPDSARLASSHTWAGTYFDAHRTSIREIPATLALQNRSLASITALAFGRPSIRRDELATLLGRYRGLYGAWRPTAESVWAKPYVDLMAELMTEIRLR